MKCKITQKFSKYCTKKIPESNNPLAMHLCASLARAMKTGVANYYASHILEMYVWHRDIIYGKNGISKLLNYNKFILFYLKEDVKK